MPVKRYTGAPYIPTQQLTGDTPPSLLRGENFWIRGRGDNLKLVCYGGHKNLNEIIPTAALTGTISFSPASRTITGASTAFYDELHIGQFIITLAGEILVVEEVTSDTTFRAYTLPLSTASNVFGYRMPVLFEIGKKRGTLLSGNALEFDKGTILAVGSGTLRINGQPLAGTSLAATRAAKVAIYNASTATYTVYPMGFNGVPTGITGSNVAGGTRGMLAGKYSIRVVKTNSVTGGYGNPGEKINITLATGEKIRLANFALTSGDLADGFDSWTLFGNRNGGSTALNDQSYANGAWYKVKFLKQSDLIDADADGQIDDYEFEYLDAEIDGTLRLLTFDNDFPPEAEYIATVAGYPVLVSCQGKGTPAKPLGTAPGSFVVPTKPANFEAAPLTGAVPLSPPETIIGMYMAAGRLYLLTANSLPIAVFTADSNFPVATRPFWKTGFKNPYAICFVNGTLYGFTSSGATRSIEGGDEGSEQHVFAADVEDIMKDWDASRVFVAHDPHNEAVCFIYSAAYKNSAGYHVSICLPYMLRQEAWNPPMVFTDNARDMIVTGAATVGGRLEFLAGGRKSDGTLEINTYRFDDEFDGLPVSYYAAWQYSDDGAEDRPKRVKFPRITAKSTNANFSVHGAFAGETIDLTALENNTNSKSGIIPVADSAGIAVRPRTEIAVKDLLVYTIRYGGTWSGSGMRDRIDEITIETNVIGARR